MNKILFSHSYFLRFDPKQWATGQPYPPLGTLYAAALMREHGFSVSLFDTMFAEGPEEVVPAMEAGRPDFFVIYDDGFNYLTKMCLTNMREAAFRMIRIAKERGCVVILSGSDSTDHYREYLGKGADFVLLGEGELGLLELLKELQDGEQDFSRIKGIAYQRKEGSPAGIGGDEGNGAGEGSDVGGGGDVVKTAARPVMKELDSLPMPAWDLVDMEKYRKTWLEHAGFFSLNIGTTRGCPFKCNWCAKPIYGNRYHAHSPRHVVAELKWLKENYSFDHIWFCDDIFGLKPGWVSEFADLIEQEGLELRFKIQSRADLLVQENYVRSLARAGCESVWMGAESGSQKILDAMDKGTTVEQIAKATQLLRDHGIRPSFFIQFGYLGETGEDIRKTVRMINELLPDDIGISVSYPLPGTVFYDRVKAGLSAKTNWTDSDDLQVLFKNTFAPPFYKQLHRYVHKSYRWHKALRQLKSFMAHPSTIRGGGLRKIAAMAYYTPGLLVAKWKLHRLEKPAQS